MANRLYRNGIIIHANEASVDKGYVDTLVENTKTNLQSQIDDKEDFIQELTKSQYEALTPVQKYNKTFLVTGYDDITDELAIATAYTVNAGSTHDTYPTSKATYNLVKQEGDKYYNKTETYSSDEIDKMFGKLSVVTKEIAESVPDPADADDNTIYWVLKSPGVYEQWTLIEDKMVSLGTTESNMNNYVKKETGKGLSEMNVTQSMVNSWNDSMAKDGILTIQKNSKKIGTFSANESANVTIDIPISVDKINGDITEKNIYAPVSSGVYVEGNAGNAIEANYNILLSKGENAAPSWTSLVNLIYPIGSIYMSINDINPAYLFGGNWEQIEDKFLLGASANYAAGTTGGEAVHTLSQAEVPNINGEAATASTTVSIANSAIFDSSASVSISDYTNLVNASMANQAHNNMPPYLSVYIWKRTA